MNQERSAPEISLLTASRRAEESGGQELTARLKDFLARIPLERGSATACPACQRDQRGTKRRAGRIFLPISGCSSNSSHSSCFCLHNPDDCGGRPSPTQWAGSGCVWSYKHTNSSPPPSPPSAELSHFLPDYGVALHLWDTYHIPDYGSKDL
jgi:hypothetical protein